MRKPVVILLAVLLAIPVALWVSLPTIDLDDYPVTPDAGVLTPAEGQAFRAILAAVEAGEGTVNYEGEINAGRLKTHLGLYYGSAENVSALFKETDTGLELNLYALRAKALNKITVEARVDEALSTMKEGPDRYKLWQISNYLADRMEYDLAHRETIDGLNGEGCCATYAMLFYKMASRLGIETYICYGYANEYHAWNMVVLDGEEYFYDITWFDGDIHDFRYLHSSTSWGREYVLNDLWEGAKRK